MTAVFVPGTNEPDESQRASHTNLPAQLTPLVGREQEVKEACALLRSEQTRLLTLTGPGGVGKTRLGIRVAGELAGEFADGVCFVPLAPVRKPDLVLSSIARTLGVRELGEKPLCERLGELLKERELLLFLDNFEQVVEAAPRVAELLAVCPRLKVLTTSREVLHLSYEWVVSVPPLGLPDPKRLPEDIQALSEYEGIAYFVERARAAKPDFRLTEEYAPVVAEICARLDGLPLGIQLAAARIRLLSPRAILDRLRRRLRLLKGGPQDAPARQKTLRDAAFYQESLVLYREVEEREGIALLTCCMGRIARIQGDYGRAAALYDECLRLYTGLGNRLGIATALEGMAALHAAYGQPEPATRLWAAAEAVREEIGAPLENVERTKQVALIAAARETLGEAAFANAWAEGRELTPEQALEAWCEQDAAGFESAITPAQLAGLTAGETKVLCLVASGMTNAQVAEKHFISRRTVEAHLRSIYRKLGGASRTEAARHAIERGLL